MSEETEQTEEPAVIEQTQHDSVSWNVNRAVLMRYAHHVGPDPYIGAAGVRLEDALAECWIAETQQLVEDLRVVFRHVPGHIVRRAMSELVGAADLATGLREIPEDMAVEVPVLPTDPIPAPTNGGGEEDRRRRRARNGDDAAAALDAHVGS